MAIDFETTGLNPYKHSITELAAIRVQPGRDQHPSISCLVRQEKRIPKAIVALTGITDEMVAAHGLPLDQAIAGLVDFIGDLPIVAYNADFDLGFLNVACTRLNVKAKRKGGHSCALKLARKVWDYLPSYRLSDVAAHLRLDCSNPHRAMGDATRAAQIYNLGALIR